MIASSLDQGHHPRIRLALNSFLSFYLPIISVSVKLEEPRESGCDIRY